MFISFAEFHIFRSLVPPLIFNSFGSADGSCMLEFKWNGGGEWNRKSWSADLPTDSAILFYLFAAFLAAPKWVFRNEDPSRIESPNGVLYLGKIPPRVTGEYYAIIPTRPPAKSKVGTLLLLFKCFNPLCSPSLIKKT